MKTKQTVILLGSGALKIGEAGEFDYSGSQAIKALKEEGVRVILVNPNIATIQTSEGLADEIYFLPVTAPFVEKVIAKERPSGILLSFGGQTALNCGIELFRKGIFKKYHVEILGTPIHAIMATEDRKTFAKKLSAIQVSTARGKTVSRVQDASAVARDIGYPVMVRAGFALGGTGSGIAKNPKELERLAQHALATAPQIIIEQSLFGWKEVEYEVVRDKNDNCITVCNMENLDPVGIHTGESIVIAPSQTLNDSQYYHLRQMSIGVIRMLGIIGECNIQFAIHPASGEILVIEVNARLSRSSALASKATGYPLAYVAAKLAMGKTLPEIPNLVTGQTTAFFEPALDYVVVKMPRWDLDKFSRVEVAIGSEMKSVGEVMSIARSFEEAIQKAARMLQDGYFGVIDSGFVGERKSTLLAKLSSPTTQRIFTICSALYAGISIDTIYRYTRIDRWFLYKLQNVVDVYKELKAAKQVNTALLLKAKKFGFSDKQIADICKRSEIAIRNKRTRSHIFPFIKRIDTMAGEFPAKTNYLYCTYNASVSDILPQSGKRSMIVLGCGPYSIGTSVEFDWCAVNTAKTLKERGFEAVMINCNPETVSTDFDISHRLYFEELSLERILDIYAVEHAPCIVAVGGQVSNNLALPLSRAGVRVIGTKPKNIYRAEHRKTFSKLLDTLHILQPEWDEVRSLQSALQKARRIGFPLLVRPSFVLSGKAMDVIHNEKELMIYVKNHELDLKEYPMVMTKFLTGAIEFDLDGVAQHGTILVHALSEHVEHGGIHSGDATLILPPPTASHELQKRMISQTAKIVRALSVTGPFNMQFLVFEGEPYVIECNLRASRSMPFVSKVKNVNFIKIATDVMVNIKHTSVSKGKNGFFAVKVPQFSFHKLRGADPVTRVEMASTGEVAAFGLDPYEAYLKAMLATNVQYPTRRAALISLGGATAKLDFVESAKKLIDLGFIIFATNRTQVFLKEYGVPSTKVGKIHETIAPNVYDLLMNAQVDFVVNVPQNEDDTIITDGYIMRRIAIDRGIPLFSNTDSGKFFIDAIVRYNETNMHINSWQTYVTLPTKEEE